MDQDNDRPYRYDDDGESKNDFFVLDRLRNSGSFMDISPSSS